MAVEPTLAEAKAMQRKQRWKPYSGPLLTGTRSIVPFGSSDYPTALEKIPDPPRQLYIVGNVEAASEGLAVIGARKATPYGRACAQKFAGYAASRGICIISGGARGCDGYAHRAALDAGGRTVVFLGGGCDQVYPANHFKLFQSIVDSGGAVISEHTWDFPALPYTFRKRNRLIAGLARATLIVEAGLPSGTFSTADEALNANKDVLVVPGSICSPTSAGSNRLLYQGATPIVDSESFEAALCAIFGFLHQETYCEPGDKGLETPSKGGITRPYGDRLYAALCADPMRMDQLAKMTFSDKNDAYDDATWLNVRLAELQRDGLIARFPDGRYGPCMV